MGTDFMVEVRNGSSEPVRQRTLVTTLGKELMFTSKGKDPKARFRRPGREWPSFRGPLAVFDDTRSILAKEDVGTRLFVQRKADGMVMVISKVREPVPTAELHANPKIEAIYALTHDQFRGNLRDAGVFVCKCVDQSGPCVVSRHGFIGEDAHGVTWRGAAWDVFVINGGMEELKKVARFIVAKTIEGALHARTVIVDNEQWKDDGAGWRPYTGARHFHLHVDVEGGTACSP